MAPRAVVRRVTKHDIARPAVQLVAKNERQAAYIKALKEATQVIVMGPAGTGKTYIAATFAASLYLAKRIDKIIITRPNVAAGRSIGFFPGSLSEKMEPWLAPIVDVLRKHLPEGVIETAMKAGNIQVVPFEVMRGRSFENALVILDEAQNTTDQEMKMFLTRVGEDCKVILNGDIGQSDLKGQSGLKTAITLVQKYSLPVPIIEFQIEDIVRSDLCRMWIEAFHKEGT
jgi:phosphate starvation-inducible PhoH-like protein